MAFCPYCGSEYNPDMAACPICGKKISPALRQKVKAAPEGEWVRATMIPWWKIGKAAVIVVLAATLVAGGIWAFSDNGIFGGDTPTIPTNPPTTEGTVPSQTTQPGTTAPDVTNPPSTGTAPADPPPTNPGPTTQPPTEPGPTTQPPTIPVEVSIVGTWHGQVNAAAFFNKKLEQEFAELAKYLSVDSLMVTVVLRFTEDGIMTYYLDQDSYCEAVADCKDVWVTGFGKFIEDTYGMTPDNYKELTGMTLETLVENLILQLQNKDMEASTKSSVSYTYRDDYLALGNNMGEFVVELKATQLRFLEYTGKYDDASLESIFTSTVFDLQ